MPLATIGKVAAVPAPAAISAEVRQKMSRQRKRDTAPELALRRALHARGLRFFVDRPVVPGQRRRADIVFPRWRLAVFADGCFWHGCPQHGHRPNHNGAWWHAKLERNRRRDRDTDASLRERGWVSLRVWEHERPQQAVERVLDHLYGRGWPGPTSPAVVGGPDPLCSPQEGLVAYPVAGQAQPHR